MNFPTGNLHLVLGLRSPPRLILGKWDPAKNIKRNISQADLESMDLSLLSLEPENTPSNHTWKKKNMLRPKKIGPAFHNRPPRIQPKNRWPNTMVNLKYLPKKKNL
jgi:hypothetical protein